MADIATRLLPIYAVAVTIAALYFRYMWGDALDKWRETLDLYEELADEIKKFDKEPRQ